jgi:gas vesicle protein
MKTSYLVFAALGAAALLLLTSDKANKLRHDVADNAGDWTKRLRKLASKSGNELASLKNIVSSEIEGLSEDARERIAGILDEGGSSTKRIRKAAKLS